MLPGRGDLFCHGLVMLTNIFFFTIHINKQKIKYMCAMICNWLKLSGQTATVCSGLDSLQQVTWARKWNLPLSVWTSFILGSIMSFILGSTMFFILGSIISFIFGTKGVDDDMVREKRNRKALALLTCKVIVRNQEALNLKMGMPTKKNPAYGRH